MKQVLTRVVRIEPTAEQYRLLNDTAVAFANSCTWINDNVNSNLTNRNSIQAVCYKDVKSQFGLTSNHVVRACARVGANRLTAKQKRKKVRGFKPTSFDRDARTFRIIDGSTSFDTAQDKPLTVNPACTERCRSERSRRVEEGDLVSLSTTGKRVKIPMRVSNYHTGKLKGQNPTSAQVCLHTDGNFYVHIQLKTDAPKTKKSKNVIGVDFGRRDIAVTSTGKSWSGKTIQKTRDQYSKTRASLQKKASQGTRSTPRLRSVLKRLSGRERRFQAGLNHNISSSIINEAVATDSSVAIEDLTGIRERTNDKPRNKTERRRSNSWVAPFPGFQIQGLRGDAFRTFYQLRNFLEYKGIKEGVNVIAIPSYYTSQTCHKCLHVHPVSGKSYRSGKNFKCGNCGNTCDADFNGSKMIEIWGASVAAPGGSKLLSCELSYDSSGLLKAYTERRSRSVWVGY